MSDALLQDVYSIVHGHAIKKGESDNQTLTRIAGKLLKRLHHPRRTEIMSLIRAERVQVVKQQWPMDRALKFKGNKVLVDGDDTIPLIVLIVDGRYELIDGGKRITRWRSRGYTHSPWVLVITLA